MLFETIVYIYIYTETPWGVLPDGSVGIIGIMQSNRLIGVSIDR